MAVHQRFWNGSNGRQAFAGGAYDEQGVSVRLTAKFGLEVEILELQPRSATLGNKLQKY
ncbi:MAG: hypothetical protein R8G34_13705 [Paracoccaceae bacterium]|nr:hypothetical protein [Paracoccaceae bacterium]